MLVKDSLSKYNKTPLTELKKGLCEVVLFRGRVIYELRKKKAAWTMTYFSTGVHADLSSGQT